MPFRQSLDQWSSRSLIRGAAIVSEDGLLIHSRLDGGVDGEALAALAVAVRRDGEQFGAATGSGLLRTTVLDLAAGPAIVTALDARHTLVVLAHPDRDLGQLLFDIRTGAPALAGAV